jgi:hypothetical protein
MDLARRDVSISILADFFGSEVLMVYFLFGFAQLCTEMFLQSMKLKARATSCLFTLKMQNS